MDWDDLIDLIGQLNTDKEQQELLGRYIAIYNDYMNIILGICIVLLIIGCINCICSNK